MSVKAEILKRTFEAAKYPKGSAERRELNRAALTSEYMTSYKYVVRWPAVMSDGTPTGWPFDCHTTRTRAEAEEYILNHPTLNH